MVVAGKFEVDLDWLSIHFNYACLDLTIQKINTPYNTSLGYGSGSYARKCHTLLHFVTLFNTFHS
jgi:hypothetical protein